MHQLLLDLAPPPAPTLDNFAPGRNAELLHGVRAWLCGTSVERTLYLWGPPGSGKTHLLHALVSAARDENRPARYLAASSLPDAELEGQCARVVLDDIHVLSASGQAALFTLLNRAARGELRLLLAGEVAPAGLALREDVRTRVGAALVFQLHPLSDEDKAHALQAHALGRGFVLPYEAAEYLLRHANRDLRWLLSALDALDRYSLQTRRPITLPLLREVLGTRVG